MTVSDGVESVAQGGGERNRLAPSKSAPRLRTLRVLSAFIFIIVLVHGLKADKLTVKRICHVNWLILIDDNNCGYSQHSRQQSNRDIYKRDPAAGEYDTVGERRERRQYDALQMDQHQTPHHEGHRTHDDEAAGAAGPADGASYRSADDDYEKVSEQYDVLQPDEYETPHHCGQHNHDYENVSAAAAAE